MKDIVYEKAHTTKLEENFELFSINPNKSLESTKNIVKLLIDNLLLSKVDAHNMITVQEIENYIINLLENWDITKKTYVNLYIKSWAIMLWEYLIHKWIISKEDNEKVLKIQKENKKKYWEIIIEEWIINDYKEFSLALKELGIIRLWEYFLWKWDISPQQLNMFLKMQKVKNKSFWQLLIEFWITNQEELNTIFNELNIVINYDEFWIDDTDWYYKLKED